MAENKTKPGKASVTAFINSIEDKQKRSDVKKVAAMMREATGSRATMWGSSIIGFGSYHYKYASGREADWMLVGFSPRKQALTLYIMSGFDGYDELMANLGKHKTGKSCLYINKLEDIDLDTLRELVRQSVEHMIATNAESA